MSRRVKRAEVNRAGSGRSSARSRKRSTRDELPGGVVLARLGRRARVRRRVRRGGARARAARGAARHALRPRVAHQGDGDDARSTMLLVAEGQHSPSTRRLRPTCPRSPSGAREDHVRHLLTHSSGLRPWRAVPRRPARERDRKRGEHAGSARPRAEEIVARVLRSALVHEPGEASVYGDLDFIALGALIEAVAGEELDAFCARADLPAARHGGNAVQAGAAVRGSRARYAATEQCRWRERVLWGGCTIRTPGRWAAWPGHAGLFATAADVLRFAQRDARRRARALGASSAPRSRARFFRRQEIATGQRLGARLGHADRRGSRRRAVTSRSARSATPASPARACGSTSSAA